jgi:hypothetical protein
LRYPWHPLGGRTVAIRLGERFTDAVRTVDEHTGEYTLIPVWMFDARCDRMRIENAPRVALEALCELKELLGAITRTLDVSTSSNEIGTHGEPTHPQTTDGVTAPASADSSPMDGAAGAVSPGVDSTPGADARAACARGAARRQRGVTR